MCLLCLLHQQVSSLPLTPTGKHHIRIYSFSYSFPLWFIAGYCIEFSVLCNCCLSILCVRHPDFLSRREGISLDALVLSPGNVSGFLKDKSELPCRHPLLQRSKVISASNQNGDQQRRTWTSLRAVEIALYWLVHLCLLHSPPSLPGSEP